MANLVYLLGSIPNEVVSANYLVVHPERANTFYLLGNLPKNRAFLLCKYTTKQRDSICSSYKPVGWLIYNTTENTIEQYLQDGQWQPFNIPAYNPMLSSGDLITGDDLGESIRIGLGPNGTVLTSDNGLPKWKTPTGSGSSADDDNDIEMNMTWITTDYLLKPTDFTVCANCSDQTITIFCPLQGMALGQIFTIKRMDDSSNNLIISGNGYSIDEASTQSISDQWDAVSIQWTGYSWIQI